MKNSYLWGQVGPLIRCGVARCELSVAGWVRAVPALALRKAYENAAVVGSSMVVVDAIDERAARFYSAHGFIPLPESMRLVLPMRTIGAMVPE